MYRSARLIASFVRESLCAHRGFHPLQMNVQELKLAWVNTQKDKLGVRAFSLVLRLFSSGWSLLVEALCQASPSPIALAIHVPSDHRGMGSVASHLRGSSVHSFVYSNIYRGSGREASHSHHAPSSSPPAIRSFRAAATFFASASHPLPPL